MRNPPGAGIPELQEETRAARGRAFELLLSVVLLSTLFGVALNLAVLCYFKYTNFLFDSFGALSGTPLPFVNVVLPLGI